MTYPTPTIIPHHSDDTDQLLKKPDFNRSALVGGHALSSVGSTTIRVQSARKSAHVSGHPAYELRAVPGGGANDCTSVFLEKTEVRNEDDGNLIEVSAKPQREINANLPQHSADARVDKSGNWTNDCSEHNDDPDSLRAG